MKPQYSIAIPKPCHENWSEMTPNERGRFCQSCSKTVIDFTQMEPDQIQEFIHHHKHQRICGHIRQNQLNTLNLKIPESVFMHPLSFHKLFLLALLLTMGTSLLNCADEKGRPQKIERIEIVEATIDTIETQKKIENHPKNNKQSKDSSSLVSPTDLPKKTHKTKPPTPAIEGLIIVGEIIEADTTDSNIGIVEPPVCPSPKRKSTNPYLLDLVDNVPEFPNTSVSLSKKEKKTLFKQKISEIIQENFNTDHFKATPKGKQKVYAQFTIDSTGVIKAIKVRSSHPDFDRETRRVINLLPQFTPAVHSGKKVAVNYTLPIVFTIED